MGNSGFSHHAWKARAHSDCGPLARTAGPQPPLEFGRIAGFSVRVVQRCYLRAFSNSAGNCSCADHSQESRFLPTLPSARGHAQTEFSRHRPYRFRVDLLETNSSTNRAELRAQLSNWGYALSQSQLTGWPSAEFLLLGRIPGLE